MCWNFLYVFFFCFCFYRSVTKSPKRSMQWRCWANLKWLVTNIWLWYKQQPLLYDWCMRDALLVNIAQKEKVWLISNCICLCHLLGSRSLWFMVDVKGHVGSAEAEMWNPCYDASSMEPWIDFILVHWMVFFQSVYQPWKSVELKQCLCSS